MPAIRKTLKKIKYKGWLTVERSRNAKDVRNVRGNFGDNVAYLKEVFKLPDNGCRRQKGGEKAKKNE